MTKVTITKLNSNITEIECDGHTGYGVSGDRNGRRRAPHR